MSYFLTPFTPNHVNLINACYPSSSALLASGSTFLPLPQELSRLTYYASNKADASGKLAKLGIELEKRAGAESRKARGGNARARAQLLVTVSIFKAITNECKRDVGLFTRMLLSATRDALACLPNDLELQARVASLFTAWATYTDGKTIGPDLRCTNDYIAILEIFHDRCRVTGKDSEVVNRMRLIGLAAMHAAVSSDVFYSSSEQFPRQVAIAIPALLHSLQEADIHIMTNESSVISTDPSPNSPYLSEFQPRPIMDRRAASIHAHIDGEIGPELTDVVNASLRALRALLSRCNGAQVAIVFDTILGNIDKANLWGDTAVGRWYAEHVIDWCQYQYRYAVPSRIVERLWAIQASPSSSPKHFALVDMLTTILNSPTPLINLSTSDVISSLITILLRRVSIDPTDQLLSPLVECISSLGTHVYYADQIHDLAEEVVNRIVNVQVNGVLGRGRASNGHARETGLKCLLSCLSGLSEAADRHAAKYNAKLADDVAVPIEAGDGDRPPSESTSTTARAARRNKVSPESWQETLALLCESDYGIRAMYARGLAAFIRGEVRKEPFVLQEEKQEGGAGTSTRNVKVVVDPGFKVSSRPSILAADSTSRFLNALHATAFTLVTSPSITNMSSGVASSSAPKGSASPAPYSNINVIPPSNSNLPTPNAPPFAIDFGFKPPSARSSATGDDAPPTPEVSESAVSSIAAGSDLSPVNESGKRHSRQQNGSRKLSVVMSMLDGSHVPVNTMLSDFSLIRHIFVCAHQQVPTRAVLTGVPMLLALEKLARKLTEAGQHHVGCLRAIRELVCHVWSVIGEVWDVPAVIESANAALRDLDETILPLLPDVSPTRIHPPEEPISFPATVEPLKRDSCGIVDIEVAVTALASSNGLQAVTGLDKPGLLRRFMIDWTVEGALKDSVESPSNQDILRGEAPFLKLSPNLMHENMSLASLARSTYGGVGVDNLREALGRGSVSNVALATASQSSTVERSQSRSGMSSDGRIAHPEPLAISRIKSKRGKAPRGEVRDALNKIGIGKQSTGGTILLRAPFSSSAQKGPSDPSNNKPKRDTSLVDPPY